MSLFKAGKVLSHALSSLESPTPSHQQRANAALLLANMARNEENCRVLVEKGAMPLLVSLTKRCVCAHIVCDMQRGGEGGEQGFLCISCNVSSQMMGKLHYLALSALRNLSMSGE